MATTDTDHGFEWVVNESGFQAEVEEHAPPEPDVAPPPARVRELWHLPRRLTWLYILLPTAAVLVLVWGFIQWRDWQTRSQVQAALSRSQSIPRWLPLNFLQPADFPLTLRAVTSLGANRVRAEVEYAFTAPDESPVRFSVPLLFGRHADQWSFAGMLSDDTPNQIHTRTSQHLELRYLGVDAEFMVETLGPYLDEVLARVCEQWRCHENVRVTLDFSHPTAVSSAVVGRSASMETAAEPLLFHVLRSQLVPPDLSKAWLMPPPHIAGYPADAESLQLYRRSLAVNALILMAHATQTGLPRFDRSNSALFYALLARDIERVGLDGNRASALSGVDQSVALNELVNPFTGQSVSDAQRRKALRSALALVNELLRDQPQEVEQEIFRAAREREDSFGVVLKLIGSLGERGLKPEEILRRMQTVLNPGETEPWQLNPTFTPELVLTCETGLYAYGAGQSQRLLPSTSPGFGAWAADWSPDGRRLALGTFFHGFMLDLETGETRWTPDVSGDAASPPVGFTASGTLAYHKIAWPTGSDFDFSKVEWRLFDPSGDGIARTGAWGFWSMGSQPIESGQNFSPDRQWALVLEKAGGGDEGVLKFSIMPADGGETNWPRTGFMPAWSPDSRRLAYFAPLSTSTAPLQLVVYDLPTQTSLAVLTFDWAPTPDREVPQVIWSPTGERLAFVLGTSNGERMAFGVVSPSGDGLQLASVESSGVSRFAFSPDGKTLALLLPKSTQHNLVLYDAATLKPVRTLVGQWRDFSWSPDGRLLLLDSPGVFILADPANPLGSQASQLLKQNCSHVL
ncbi:MAG: hypothetical protein ACT4QE_14430, partial [Anaerolineales bacterium]